MGSKFFKFAVGVLSVVLLGCTQSGEVSNEASLENASEKSELSSNTIILGESTALGQVASELAREGGHVLRNLEFAEGLVAQVPGQALKGLQKRFPNVNFIEDVEVHAYWLAGKPEKPGASSPPPAQSVPWGISAVEADSAQMISKGEGVKVCVVDTGIDKFHPDLAANIVGGRNFVVRKGRLDSSQWDDDNGHGSHVSGIIAAVDNEIGTVGVAPKASLYGVKVLDARGSGSLSSVIDGINECINAQTHVINMSLGATVSPTGSTGLLMQAAVDAARNAGIEVVVAAGNEGQDIANVIPAGLKNLIAVAAIDVNGSFPSWSNFGLSLKDHSAPGVSIYSTWKGGGYNTISGTSMASPHVAGVAALRISSGQSNYAFKDLGQSVSVQGAGLVDALATVTASAQ